VRAVEIRRTSLSSDVVLIVEYLFAEDRGAVKPKAAAPTLSPAASIDLEKVYAAATGDRGSIAC